MSTAIRDISEFGPSLELDLARRILNHRMDGKPGRMIDVGANVGSSCAPFLQAGWSVMAIEPDPRNMKALREALGHHTTLTTIEKAVSDREGEELTLYIGTDSAMSALRAYDPSHTKFCSVVTTTLKTCVTEQGWSEVDLVKVDAEGFDLPVLRGYDFEAHKPRVVVAEFDNHKTKPLGYSTEDMAAFIAEKGYRLLYSERFPLVDYDPETPRRRRRFDAGQVVDEASWGDIVAFRDQEDFEIAQVMAPALLDMQRRIWKLEAESVIDQAHEESDRSPPKIIL